MLLGEGPVSIPFSVSLKLQFADDLNHFIGAETIPYSQKNRLVKNTLLNISINTISCRSPPSPIAFGFMNYFNWFIYYHVTALGGKENPTLILL